MKKLVSFPFYGLCLNKGTISSTATEILYLQMQMK